MSHLSPDERRPASYQRQDQIQDRRFRFNVNTFGTGGQDDVDETRVAANHVVNLTDFD